MGYFMEKSKPINLSKSYGKSLSNLTPGKNVATVITLISIQSQEPKSMENQTRVRDAKLVSIGNSKGLRIPKALLQKYGLKNSLLIEETDRGLLLRNKEESKLSWEETYKAMANQRENWEDFDSTLFDGLRDEDVVD